MAMEADAAMSAATKRRYSIFERLVVPALQEGRKQAKVVAHSAVAASASDRGEHTKGVGAAKGQRVGGTRSRSAIIAYSTRAWPLHPGPLDLRYKHALITVTLDASAYLRYQI